MMCISSSIVEGGEGRTTRRISAEVAAASIGLRGGVAGLVGEELHLGTVNGGGERCANNKNGREFHYKTVSECLLSRNRCNSLLGAWKSCKMLTLYALFTALIYLF